MTDLTYMYWEKGDGDVMTRLTKEYKGQMGEGLKGELAKQKKLMISISAISGFV